jgi:hypothetical protein
LSAEANAVEKAPDPCWQPLYRVDRVHHHLPGRRDWSRRVCCQCLREHFRLTGLRQFHDCRNLGDANPEHFQAVRLEGSDVTAEREVRGKPIGRHFFSSIRLTWIDGSISQVSP